MKEIKIRKIDLSSGTMGELSVNINDLKEPSAKLINMVVDWQLRGKRAASANVKEMSEISGTTKKPYKQKGTGNARQGSKRSVQFVGGRTCHGPKGRVFDFSFPKKSKNRALEFVVKKKFLEKSVFILDNIDGLKKTKEVQKIINENKINSLLILYREEESSMLLAARNIKNCKVLDVSSLNVYDLINYDKLLISQTAYKDYLEKILAK